MFCGIDLGTSAVKLLLMDEEGRIVKTVSREYPLYIPKAGFSEQRPEDWWEKTCDGISELIASIPANEIKAISFSGQMHGLVVLDENDNVIRPAILWNDQRTTIECDLLNQQDILSHAANRALTGFTLPKLLWLRFNEPENFKKIKKIMLPKDYISYKLTNVFAMDFSDASGTLLLDVKNRQWSEFMMDIGGIERKQLASLYESYECIGTVCGEAAQKTGLLTDTKVIIGGGDQAVGAVGTGTVSGNLCSISLGTSGVVFASTPQFCVDRSASAIHSFCDANGGYHLMGVTLAAAASTKWWIEGILDHKDYAAAQVGIDMDKPLELIYLPYLSGERTPHNDPFAKGVFYGLTTSTTQADMTRAVLEGVSYSLREVLEAMKPLGVSCKAARIIGGGAKSDLWCQLISNVLGMVIERINTDEGPAFGAAILAAVGCGHFTDVKTACDKLITVTQSFKPEVRPDLDANFQRYKELYQKLKGF